MAKVRNSNSFLSELQQSIAFTEFDFYHLYEETFKVSELGRIKSLLPLREMTEIYRQQKNYFESGDSRESIPDRIVSVSKPYIRPIVRGKEVKTVEYGKVGENRLKKKNIATCQGVVAPGAMKNEKIGPKLGR